MIIAAIATIITIWSETTIHWASESTSKDGIFCKAYKNWSEEEKLNAKGGSSHEK